MQRPALHVGQAQVVECLSPFRRGIEAGYVVKRLAAFLHEGCLDLHGDFFQGFQAIAGESRADHFQILHPFLSEFADGGFGVRLQPFGAAKTALEGHLVLVRLQLKALYSRSLTGVVQTVIQGVGLTAMVLLAGREALAGSMTVGGFVLVNSYLMQVLRPLAYAVCSVDWTVSSVEPATRVAVACAPA